MKDRRPIPYRIILACKVISSEYGLPKKIMSDTGSNLVSDKVKQFCKILNIEQATSFLYHHQSKEQVEVCTKLIRHTIKKALILKKTNM